jgi:ubiquitin C-terminal hydrolase
MSGPSPGDPKIVMDIVAKHHSQFRSRNSLSIAGTSEQQDSHEFLSALMDVLSMEERSAVQHETRIPVIEALETADNADEQIISMHRTENGSANKENQHNEPEEEEKKLDDKIPMHYQNSNIEEEQQPTTAVNIEDATSSGHQQRNPFDGWLGSTIKCATCSHIRPIRSNPFICLSLPIASVRSEYLEDFLASEYGGFSTEQVSDVQCVSCDIKEKVTELEEEVLLLSGAIDSMKRRKKDQAAGLQSELLSKKRHIAILKGMDADNDEEIEHHNEEDISFSIAGLSKIIPMRGNAHKATLIIRSPTVLGIHVQRRHFDMSSQQMMKMSRRVHFPEVLDISQYCSVERLYANNKANGKKLPYRLMSVVEHKGNAFGGHYQTYRRAGSKEDDWVLVSDESVLPVSWKDVQRCEAYMLLYEKIN